MFRSHGHRTTWSKLLLDIQKPRKVYVFLSSTRIKFPGNNNNNNKNPMYPRALDKSMDFSKLLWGFSLVGCWGFFCIITVLSSVQFRTEVRHLNDTILRSMKKHLKGSSQLTGIIPWEVFTNCNGPKPVPVQSEKRSRSVFQLDGLGELNFVWTGYISRERM